MNHNPVAKLLFDVFTSQTTVVLPSAREICALWEGNLWWIVGNGWRCQPWRGTGARYYIDVFEGSRDAFTRDVVELKLYFTN